MKLALSAVLSDPPTMHANQAVFRAAYKCSPGSAGTLDRATVKWCGFTPKGRRAHIPSSALLPSMPARPTQSQLSDHRT